MYSMHLASLMQPRSCAEVPLQGRRGRAEAAAAEQGRSGKRRHQPADATAVQPHKQQVRCNPRAATNLKPSRQQAQHRGKANRLTSS